MSYRIDMSGKVEHTSKDTILCLSNGRWDAVRIKAKTKRDIQEMFRLNSQIRNFILFVFCAGLAILLRRNLGISEVLIDKEYFGKESIIKNLLLKMLYSERVPRIEFGLIGKKALAHNRAYAINLGKLSAKKVISVKEILEELKKTEVTLS